MSRLIQALHTDVQGKAYQLILDCHNEEILIKVTQTYRTFQEQQVIWEQGRVTPGRIITNAPPGYSWHNWRRAFDIAIIAYPNDITPKDYYDGPWGHVGELAEKLGLEWGGRWKHPDSPHFQYTEGVTLLGLLKEYPEGFANG